MSFQYHLILMVNIEILLTKIKKFLRDKKNFRIFIFNLPILRYLFLLFLKYGGGKIHPIPTPLISVLSKKHSFQLKSL